MRYLRMLTNAIAGGVLVAIYLVVLVLQLNPHVPVVSMTAGRWFVRAACVLRAVPERRPVLPDPGARSARVAAAVAGLVQRAAARVARRGRRRAAAFLTWANLRGFRAVLTEAAAERMRQGAVATTICAAVLVAIAVAPLFVRPARAAGRRRASCWRRWWLSVTVPLWLRGPGELPVPARPAAQSGA